jgi:phage regulator Rha-like protein
MAEGLGVDHRSTMRLIERFQSEMEDFGQVRFEITPARSGGVPQRYCLLTENQSYFLLTLSRNTRKVITLKQRLVREFDKLRRQAEKRASLDWQQARDSGKAARRIETDVVRDFVEYAIAQGSTSATRYYGNLTKMTYKELFFAEQGLKKPDHFRDLLGVEQLVYLMASEHVAANSLKTGMAEELPYKDCYKLAKECVETLAVTFGKTPLLETAE